MIEIKYSCNCNHSMVVVVLKTGLHREEMVQQNRFFSLLLKMVNACNKICSLLDIMNTSQLYFFTHFNEKKLLKQCDMGILHCTCINKR